MRYLIVAATLALVFISPLFSLSFDAAQEKKTYLQFNDDASTFEFITHEVLQHEGVS